MCRKPAENDSTWIWWFLFSNWIGQITIVLMLFIVPGIFVYTIHNGWGVTLSMYYALQAGFSIGYGVVKEPDEASRLFTVFLNLLGSLAIMWFLNIIVGIYIEKQKKYLDSSSKTLFTNIDGDGDGLITLAELKHWLLTQNKYTLMFEDAEHIFHEIDSDDNGTITLDEFISFVNKQKSCLIRLKLFCVRYWMYITFIMWIGIGTMWGCFFELPLEWELDLATGDATGVYYRMVGGIRVEYKENGLFGRWDQTYTDVATGEVLAERPVGIHRDFVTSLWHAISSLATGGLLGPREEQLDMAFHIIYILIGVPLYAMNLATLGGMFAMTFIHNTATKELTDRIDKAESDYRQHYEELKKEKEEIIKIDNGKNYANIADYMELELIKHGSLQINTLHQIRKHWKSAQKNKDGHITTDKEKKRETQKRKTRYRKSKFRVPDDIGSITKRVSPVTSEEHSDADARGPSKKQQQQHIVGATHYASPRKKPAIAFGMNAVQTAAAKFAMEENG